MSHTVISPSILYFGTPVVLLSTVNPDGSANLAPMSSAWALGYTVVLGLGRGGRTAANLAERGDLVVNLPGPGLWRAVERLGRTTGMDPVPVHKRATHRFAADKFAVAGLTPQGSDLVAAPRVVECPLQLEARVRVQRDDAAGEFRIVEAEVLRVHAHPDVVVPGTSHVDPGEWGPLVYSFRHYFGLGERLGENFRAEVGKSVVAEAGAPAP